MTIDLCKPLNEGESLTVRVIMTVDEARETLAKLRDTEPSEHSLLGGIRRAVARYDERYTP